METKAAESAPYVETPEARQARLEERARIAAGIRERKRRLLDDPAAIMLVPKTRECHFMVKMTFTFDHAVALLRLKIATPELDVKQATALFGKIEAFMDTCNQMSTSIAMTGGYRGYSVVNEMSYDTPELRNAMVDRPETYMIRPRTIEGKTIAMWIKRIDPLLLQHRMTSMDLTQGQSIIKDVLRLLVQYDQLTKSLAAAVRIKYLPPKGFTGKVAQAAAAT